ncbi:hypothetical protein BVY02_01540 [bacterium J17]|nr:hypothetical protein BVY02_01540 [bacterium J17]
MKAEIELNIVVRFVFIAILFLPSAAPAQIRPIDYELFRAINQPVDVADLSLVTNALKRGADPNATRGMDTPLAFAISFGNVRMVELLLMSGADPNLCPKGMVFCPLVGAIVSTTPGYSDKEREETVSLLLEAGADPNGGGGKHHPLTMAANHNKSRIVELLTEAGAKSKSNVPPWEEPLLIAAKNCDTQSVRFLLNGGEKPDRPHDRGLTALWFATQHGCADIVNALLDAGAKYSISEKPSESFNVDWFQHIAHSKPKVLEAYLQKGLRVSHINDENETFLHLAARRGHPQSLSILLEKDLDVNALTKRLFTPLMEAARYGRADNVKVFLGANADIHLHSKWGKTAKVIAAEEEHDGIVRLLELAGAKEYSGSKLPMSRYQLELIGKDQRDVTGSVYQALDFLRPGLRFFAVHDPFGPERHDAVYESKKSVLFAVLPEGYSVVKLASVDDFPQLGFTIATEKDALSLVRVFSAPWQLLGHGGLKVSFEGLDLMEIPNNPRCLKVESSSISKEKLFHPKVSSDSIHSLGSFKITRYLVPQMNFAKFSQVSKFEHITLATERIGRNGSYSIVKKQVPSPGLVLTRKCFPR